jgi:sigma-B regulation protein RsbU (phosphoserine phosphatase)
MRLIPNEFLKLIFLDNNWPNSSQQTQTKYPEDQSVEQKDLILALNDCKRRYNDLLKAATDYTYTVTIENGVAMKTTHSGTCVEVTGFSSEEYKTRPFLWLEMIHPEDRDLVLKQTSDILSEQESSVFEHRIYHKDGSLRWIQNIIIKRYDANNQLCAYDGLVRDITTKKMAESGKDCKRNE